MNTTVSGRGVEDPQRALACGPPPEGGRPDSAGAWTAALEHEARGLLNLIAIALRCLDRSAEGGEREVWRREIQAAREQLEGLCRAGLPRDFLKAPWAGAA